jgi:hypothetical protein
MAKKKKAGTARTIKSQPASVELGPKQLTIKFDHPHQLLPKLLEVAHHFADGHVDLLIEVGPSEDVLGGGRARLIVSNCAHSTSWGSTLSELGLNPLIFRDCVTAGVDAAGYVAPDLTVTGDTKLIEVVAAIQGAPHK